MTDPRLQHLHLDVHPDITMEQLAGMEEVDTLCEGEFSDSDGVTYWVYTVVGRLNGEMIGAIDHVRRSVHGALVGGDAIIIHARDRKEADWLAAVGLMDTIDAIKKRMAQGGLELGPNSGIILETQAGPKTS
jgi:hypothetical protein